MTVLEKLIKLNNEDDHFNVYYCIQDNVFDWPEIEDKGYPGPTTYKEPLDLENWKVTELTDKNMIIKCGGDWQEPHEVCIELDSNNYLTVTSFKRTDYGEGEEIDIDKLMGFDLDN